MYRFCNTLILSLSLVALGSLAANPDESPQDEPKSQLEIGKEKFELICMACHKYERSPEMIAPPAFAIQMHYSGHYGTDESAFRKAIVDWAKAPDETKTLMPGAIQKFKLMPPLPLPDDDLDAIAAYLFHADLQGACDMPQGMGPGNGRGMGRGMGPGRKAAP